MDKAHHYAIDIFMAYGQETVSLFAPNLLQAHGALSTINDMSNGILSLSPLKRQGFLDVVLSCQFTDGFVATLLILHCQHPGQFVDMQRVHRYTAELLYRDPGRPVLPYIFVTEPSCRYVNNQLHYEQDGRVILDFRATVIHCDSDVRKHLRRENIVANLLWVIANQGSAISRCTDAIVRLKNLHATWAPFKLAWLISAIKAFAQLNEAAEQELEGIIKHDPRMRQVCRLLEDQRQWDRVDRVIDAYAAGWISKDDGSLRLRALCREGIISSRILEKAECHLQGVVRDPLKTNNIFVNWFSL